MICFIGGHHIPASIPGSSLSVSPWNKVKRIHQKDSSDLGKAQLYCFGKLLFLSSEPIPKVNALDDSQQLTVQDLQGFSIPILSFLSSELQLLLCSPAKPKRMLRHAVKLKLQYLPMYNASPFIIRTPTLDRTFKKKKGSRKQRGRVVILSGSKLLFFSMVLSLTFQLEANDCVWKNFVYYSVYMLMRDASLKQRILCLQSQFSELFQWGKSAHYTQVNTLGGTTIREKN